jgi:NADH:ubiquinone oxidoreductase subunit K
MDYIRPQAGELARRLSEPRRHIQVVAGPRQVGKSTLVHQVVERGELPWRWASADEPTLRGPSWLAQQWDAARLAARDAAARGGAVLVLDEVHKLDGWSEAVKRLWDEDTRQRTPLKVVLLGSSPLLVARGLTESLAGRFEMLHLRHWSYAEMKSAFDWPLASYVFHGGYPGAAPLVNEPVRWARYVMDSLVETSISRDVLLLTRIDKPALMRRLFELACSYSGQVLSYTKMLGPLQDAGNTTTLAHYLVLGAVLFAISIAGIFLNRKNVLILLMAIELMLLAVNLNFVAFSAHLGDMAGQVFVFFILTVAAAESAIGLAILVLLFRNVGSIDVDDLGKLKG